MAEGRIHNFKHDRGFGFIDPDDESEQRFFHISEWQGDGRPKPGTRIRFTPTVGPKGKRAEQVIPLAKLDSEGEGPPGTIWCPTCESYSRPRVVTDDGLPRYNMCPTCGDALWDLRPLGLRIRDGLETLKVWGLILFFLLLGYIVFVWEAPK